MDRITIISLLIIMLIAAVMGFIAGKKASVELNGEVKTKDKLTSKQEKLYVQIAAKLATISVISDPARYIMAARILSTFVGNNISMSIDENDWQFLFADKPTKEQELLFLSIDSEMSKQTNIKESRRHFIVARIVDSIDGK